jgi:hypothetical protein
MFDRFNATKEVLTTAIGRLCEIFERRGQRLEADRGAVMDILARIDESSAPSWPIARPQG